jgi:hypothetical protein
VPTRQAGPGAAAHFRLFALVSSARGSGPGRTEASMLTRHLAYWLDVLQDLVPHRQPRIELSVFATPVIAERLADTVRPALAGRAPLLIDEPGRTRGRGYYTAFALRIARTTGRPSSATADSPPGPLNWPTTPRNAASSPASPRSGSPRWPSHLAKDPPNDRRPRRALRIPITPPR